VTFYRLELLDLLAPDRLALAITCSAGAYVRSLAHDLGIALGTLGTLAVLRREAAGGFSLAAAHTLDAIEGAAAAGSLAELLQPPGANLPLPQVTLPPELRQRLAHGQRVLLPRDLCSVPEVGALVQVRDEDGALTGIMRCLQLDSPTAALWKAEKWLS
jgi:tRNA pseudouridine55 synthase